MTWPPAASIRAAAAITSITMKGGTLLRPEAVKRGLARSRKVASGIDLCYLPGCPRQAAFGGLVGAYIVSDPPPTVKDRSMLLRFVADRTLPKLTAVATAIALTLAPLSSRAEEEKGPLFLRDAETEKLMR